MTDAKPMPIPTDARRMLLEERAAIMEFDGGLSRSEAELAARFDLADRDRAAAHAKGERQ